MNGGMLLEFRRMENTHMSLFLTKTITAKTIAMTGFSLCLLGGLSGCNTVKNIIPGGKTAKSTTGTRIKRDTVRPRMGVNEFLWRATLETLNFMPMDSVDPFGGVIATDWYASPQAPDERF